MSGNKESSFNSREKRQLAIVNKYIADKRMDSGYDSKGNKNDPRPPSSLLDSISQRTASVNNDIESIRQLLPDVELTVQILVSSILSPKDLGQPELQFQCDADIEDEDLIGKLLDVVKEYFVNDYKINDKLTDILVEALIDKGAYIEAIIPESSVDKVINPEGHMSLESVKTIVKDDLTLNQLGIVTKSNSAKDSTLTLESMFDTSFISGNYKPIELFKSINLVDNPDTLKLPSLFSKIEQERINRTYASHYSLESKSNKNRVKEITEDVDKYKGKSHQAIAKHIDVTSSLRPSANGMLSITDDDYGKTIGHPLVLKLPTESVIPLIMPGRPNDHLGYFVVLDRYGNPIDLSNVSDHYKQIQTSFSSRTSGESTVSSIMNELKNNGFTSNQNNIANDVEEGVRVFSQIMEKKLLESLSKGGVATGLKLSQSNDVYAMMLSRALANTNTQVLYVPKEMVSYIAFNYGHNGVGKSLLEDTRILGSLRVLMMFSNTMAAIRNSTSRTELNITFDPKDVDPLSSAAMVKDAFIRARSQGFPLGEGDPSAIIKHLQQAGVDVVYGNHPDLPEMRVESNDKNSSKVGVDRDLTEDLRDWHIMGLGLSPDTVDAGRNIDFAASIVASNLLLSKRVVILQQKLESKLAKKLKMHIKYSETLMSELNGVIDANKGRSKKVNADEIIEKFVKKLKVGLPKPDAATLEAKMEGFEAYSSALDNALEAIVDSSFAMTDAEGDVADNLDEVRAAIKAYYLRRYMKENNILPELEEITSLDKDGKPAFKFDEIQHDHMEVVLGGISKYIKKAMKAAKKRQVKIDKLQEMLDREDEEEEGQSSYDSDSTDGGDADDSGNDDSGVDDDSSDDVGADADVEGDAPPSEEEF